MDERELRSFLAVAEHGTFTRAASALHVSQPTLSQRIRSLEARFGAPLFDRLGRRTILTPFGEQAVAIAERLLADIAELDAAASNTSHPTTSTLHLAALPTLAVAPLAGLIGRLRESEPNVRVEVHEPEDPDLVERSVRSGDAELGFTDLGTGGRGLARVELARQEVVAVLPPGSPAAGPLSAEQLAELPLIVTPPGTSTRRILQQVLERIDATPDIAVTINHREAIVPLVLAGAGTCLLPRDLADVAARNGAVVRSLNPQRSRRVGLLHRDAPLSAAARALVALAIADARSPHHGNRIDSIAR